MGNRQRKDAYNISEAYHKAKVDGSNPELVKAVEDLLGKQKESPPTPQTGKGEGDWSRDVESTAKALDSANGKELELLALKQSIKQLPDKDFEDAEANKNWKELQERRKAIVKDDNYLREQISNVENKKKADQVVFETLHNLPIEKSKFISEAYHKAKADGSNPELVAAVEDLLAPKVAPTTNTEGETQTTEAQLQEFGVPEQDVKPVTNVLQQWWMVYAKQDLQQPKQ